MWRTMEPLGGLGARRDPRRRPGQHGARVGPTREPVLASGDGELQHFRTYEEVKPMPTKTVPFNRTGIEKIPNNKPVVYKILTERGKDNYTGVAKRGRVQDRLKEHLPGGKDCVPGAKVQIEQMPSIEDAEAKEARIISRTKPPYNRQGK
jgi:hypothetical protein